MPKSSSTQPKAGASPAESGAAVESVRKAAPGKRRTFTAAEKLRVVREADACRKERGATEALLRREGIYSSLLTSWRNQIGRQGSDHLGSAKRGRPAKRDSKDRRIEELEKKTTRLEAKLRLAEKLIELQKKASEILGIELGNDEENS